MITVRELSPEEAAAALPVTRQAYLSAYLKCLGKKRQADITAALEIDCRLEEMQREAKSQEAILLGGFLHGQLVGSGAGQINQQEIILIRRIYLTQTGQGVGREIMSRLTQWATMQTGRALQAETLEANRQTRQWLQKQGFRKTASRKSQLYPGLKVVEYQKNLA